MAFSLCPSDSLPAGQKAVKREFRHSSGFLTLFSMARRRTAGVACVFWPLISWWVCSSQTMAGVSTTSSSWMTSDTKEEAEVKQTSQL